jgi:hypothetical protein
MFIKRCHITMSLFIVVIMFAPVLFAGSLPDSGQTKCYNNSGEIPCPDIGGNFYGQDGNYQRYLPSYKLSADGLSVADLNTGLIWQKSDDGTKRSQTAAESYCLGLAVGENTDWRIPTRQELVTIVDYGRTAPSINPIFGCKADMYWTGTDSARYPGTSGWYVDFESGFAGGISTGTLNYVRCVRDAQ